MTVVVPRVVYDTKYTNGGMDMSDESKVQEHRVVVGLYKCPKCGEDEMRVIQSHETYTEAVVDTGGVIDWENADTELQSREIRNVIQCQNPDCQAEFDWDIEEVDGEDMVVKLVDYEGSTGEQHEVDVVMEFVKHMPVQQFAEGSIEAQMMDVIVASRGWDRIVDLQWENQQDGREGEAMARVLVALAHNMMDNESWDIVEEGEQDGE